MKFSVRVSYPETGKYNWFEAVEAYKDIGLVEVESLILNYYDKTGLEINGVNGPIENWRFYYLYYYSNHIYINSISMSLQIAGDGGRAATDLIEKKFLCQK